MSLSPESARFFSPRPCHTTASPNRTGRSPNHDRLTGVRAAVLLDLPFPFKHEKSRTECAGPLPFLMDIFLFRRVSRIGKPKLTTEPIRSPHFP